MLKTVIRCTNSPQEVIFWYALLIVASSFLFQFFEGIVFWDALWLSLITAPTVGYGDISPKTLGGRVTAVVLIHVSLFIVLPLLISHFHRLLMPDPHEFTHEEQEEILQYVRQKRTNNVSE